MEDFLNTPLYFQFIPFINLHLEGCVVLQNCFNFDKYAEIGLVVLELMTFKQSTTDGGYILT